MAAVHKSRLHSVFIGGHHWSDWHDCFLEAKDEQISLKIASIKANILLFVKMSYIAQLFFFLFSEVMSGLFGAQMLSTIYFLNKSNTAKLLLF